MVAPPRRPQTETPGRMLSFENVGLRYGDAPETLQDVTFDVVPRSFQFLTGPSGAGKTTLLRMITLALRPSQGVLRVFGHEAGQMNRQDIVALRRRMGVVFQDFRLLDHLTLYENVALPLRLQSREEASYRAEVIELLDWVGLGAVRSARPPSLSGGEKQRAAIARALIARPQLVLADEPTGNVDPTLARRILRLLIEMHKAGAAVLVATHDLGLMDQYAPARRLVLADGRLLVFE
jgi:cell division transport system ATP-binding protein